MNIFKMPRPSQHLGMDGFHLFEPPLSILFFLYEMAQCFFGWFEPKEFTESLKPPMNQQVIPVSLQVMETVTRFRTSTFVATNFAAASCAIHT